MKVSVIQPYYSFDGKDNDKCYDEMVRLLDSCDEENGIIVLPEYSDVPSDLIKEEEYFGSINKYNADIMQRAKNTAIRCNSIVFVNCAEKTEKGWANVTHAIDRNGCEVGKYFKAHPAPSEVRPSAQGGYGLDVSYSYEFAEPYVVTIDGIRFGFMTCYDFYFYENFATLARQNIDVIIGCSHQRTDTHEALSIINRFLCYNTNAYLLRSSVSLGKDSKICGCSCIIAPSGEVLVDMKSEVGVGSADIDISKKYYKQAGYKGALKSHYEYIEEGRRPWLYRNGGASVVVFDQFMPYPRLCAHRGFSTVAPENTMPAFGSAIALGAKEIEFDLWETKDGEIVSCHDLTLERVSNGVGRLTEKTLDELKQLDFGCNFSEKFKGLSIVTFEEILQKFAGRVIMNVHVKTLSDHYNEKSIEKIVSLIRKYDCAKHVYFMISHDGVIKQFKQYAPDIAMCVGHLDERPWEIVERAIEMKCEKVQLFKPYFNQETVDKAHAHGIKCNVFFADEIDEAKKYIEMGIDTILTNDYLKISSALKIK
jgi:glycerophosphoryl diester phosphodiesterase/predicted amidohydrolase